MLYNHAEILCSELPVFREKKKEYFFKNELKENELYEKVGYLLINQTNKLYKPIYQYSSNKEW